MIVRKETHANLLAACAEYFIAAAQGEALDLSLGGTDEERDRMHFESGSYAQLR
jgi:hypothetical protein